jgi:hypothetical protein
LWCGRLDDILNGEKLMRAADLGNTLTNDANHNSRSWHELSERFESLRTITIRRLKNLKEEDAFKTSLHPRLKTPMRTLDLFTFVAEHDDHHLATITALTNKFKIIATEGFVRLPPSSRSQKRNLIPIQILATFFLNLLRIHSSAKSSLNFYSSICFTDK